MTNRLIREKNPQNVMDGLSPKRFGQEGYNESPNTKIGQKKGGNFPKTKSRPSMASSISRRPKLTEREWCLAEKWKQEELI